MKSELFISYFKKHTKSILVYSVYIILFFLMGWLYDFPVSAAVYSSVVALTVMAVFVALDFLQYEKKIRMLKEGRNRIATEFPELPVPKDMTEQIYQEMLEILYSRKIAAETQNDVRMKEMLDYYSMWVHQVKTPIAAMHVLLQTMKEQQLEAAGNDEEQYRRIQELNRSLSAELFKTEQYVGMVLSYLRMEDMGADLILKPCPAEPLVRQAVRKYSQMFIARRIKPVIGNLSGTMITDEKWMSFVIEQILSNALKYTEDGSIFIEMKGQNLIIRDTGIGIRKEDLPRVFEKGFTGYNGHADKKSTGIGLYLCKTVLDKLGHTVSITSEPGKGTEVRIHFERQKVDLRD